MTDPIIKEQFLSLSFSEDKDGNKTLSRVFHVYVADPVEAVEYGPAMAEQYRDQNLFVTGRSTKVLEALELIELTVNYTTPTKNNQQSRNKTVWSTSIGTEQIHINAVDSIDKRISLQTYPPYQTKKENEIGLAIGKKSDGEIEGVDIVVPLITMTCQTWKRPSEVTDKYKNTLQDLVGLVNSTTFREWRAGEVRFDGVDIREVSGELTELNFKFTCRRNITDVPMQVNRPEDGSVENILVSKEGWHYLWKQLGTAAELDSGVPGVRDGIVLAVVVNQVYDKQDFKALGLTNLRSLYGG